MLDNQKIINSSYQLTDDKYDNCFFSFRDHPLRLFCTPLKTLVKLDLFFCRLQIVLITKSMERCASKSINNNN